MTSRLSALAIASLLALPSLSAEAVSAVRLRCDDNNVKQAAEFRAGRRLMDKMAVFAAVREWKDQF